MIVEDGRITGMLRESAMTLPWDKIFPQLSDEEIKKGALYSTTGHRLVTLAL